MKILLDTGVAIRNAVRTDPLHQRVREATAQLIADGHNLIVAPQILYEFWVVLTRPIEQNGYGLDASEAAKEVRRLILTFELMEDPPTIAADWLHLCELYNVKGKTAHDTRLVAFLRTNQLDAILTLNSKDFTRYNVAVLSA